MLAVEAPQSGVVWATAYSNGENADMVTNSHTQPV